MSFEKLNEIYFDPANPGSFGGPERLSKVAHISLQKAKEFLQGRQTYTRNKYVRHKFPRRKIVVPSIDYLWQGDLITVTKFSRKNKGIKFLLTVIDVLSRYAFVRPLSNKTCSVVAKAFQDILDTSGRKCKYLQTDRGLEFRGAAFLKILDMNKINLFHNHSELKAAMIERFNRTLMLRLNKFFTFTNDTKYIDNLQDFVQSYNSSVHRSINCRPKDVKPSNQFNVWMKSYEDLQKSKPSTPKFRIGQYVRIKIQKATFEKGYASTFTTDLFKIREIVNSIPVTYKLSDNTGEIILGVFYPEELSLVKI